MTRLFALLAGMLLCGGAALAQGDDVCAVSEDVHILPELRARERERSSGMG